MDCALVVVCVTDGAPVAALVVTDAPTPPAPLKATTVSDSSKPEVDWVAVIVAPLSWSVARALQTSASPFWLFAAFTSVQASPPPDTVTVWRLVPPSEPTNANNRSPGVEVLMVTLAGPTPSAETLSSIEGPTGGALATVTITGVAVPILPAGSVARALSVWLLLATVMLSQFIV